MNNQKMPGGNPKGSSYKPSPSTSQRKNSWESGTNLKSAHDSVAAGDSKTTKPSSSSKEDPASRPSPAPSKLPFDAVPPAGPGPFAPSGAGARFLFPEPSEMGPPPPPAYGFHMLERRTIVLVDGNVRSYFALPPDYQDFPRPGRPIDPSERFLPLGPEQGDLGLGFDRRFPPGGQLSPEGFRHDRDERYGRGGQFDYWNSFGIDGRGPVPQEGSLKRKYGDEDERDEFARQRQQLLQYGNPSSNPNSFPLGSGDRADYLAGTSSPFRRDPLDPRRGIDDLRSSKHLRVGGDYDNLPSHRGVLPCDAVIPKLPDVDPQALKKAFLRYAKLINQNASQRKNYLEDGKHGPLQCLACGRKSKDFPDMHGLIMHTYNIQNADLRVDHLGLHKALCVLMGWNYAKPPENSKTYQSLSADEAAGNKDDLVMWPPLVIMHNTMTIREKGKDGRMEGMGNKVIDTKLRDLGFRGGKSKALYGKDGSMGITLVKFAGDQSGLKEAMHLAEFFEKDNHGREGWAHAQSLQVDDKNNPRLLKVDESTGKKSRILYGYLGTASDLDTVDYETRKKVAIENRKDFRLLN